MNIDYDPTFWLSRDNHYDIVSQFALVNRLHLFLRTEIVLTSRLPAVHQFHCLYFCIRGSGSIEIDGVPFFVKAGEAIGVLPHHPHRRMPGNAEVHYLLLRFTPTDPELISDLFGRILVIPESAGALISKLMSCYQEVVENSSAEANNETALYATLILNSLLSVPRNSNPQQSFLPERLNKALQLLTDPENINMPLHLIAKKLGITAGHLSDLIRDHLGYPPSRLKHTIHIRIAIHLLLHTDMNITEVAEKSGFKSVYAFSRFFKQDHGMSPREFRKLYAGKVSNICPVCGGSRREIRRNSDKSTAPDTDVPI
ncbi:MAG: AraC family transcriptional regulator [Lentisphaeria bacterium]|nr:AraC family transcriptional regulator [Lentisphaeria bacterium]